MLLSSIFCLMRFLLLPLVALSVLAPSHVSAGLRDVAGRLRIGVAGDFADPAERWDIATKEFNSVTAENACKPDAIQGQRGVFNFARCDSLYNKAKAAGMAFRGHTGIIWHGSDGGPGQNPGWLQQLSDDDKLREMVNHITRVISHYPDAYAWDVVNEALCGENNSFCSRFFPNQRKEEFVAAAFRAARAAAPPGVKLFLNDFGHEFMGSGDGMFNFIVKLRSQGVPIDGVGMQSHFNSDANIASMRQNIERYHNAGIEIHITEIDVGAQNGDFTTQARIFNDVLKACLAFQRCTSYTIWGITDERSWRGSADQCLMWKNFQPKAAYNAVYETLRTQNAPPPPTPTSGGSAIAWKKASYLVFDVPAGNNENGQKVEVWGTGGPAPNQLFSLTACGNIKWTNTDKCLDVAGGVDANGVAIQLWQCSCQNPNQLFDWIPSGLLKWRGHTRCIDVIGGVVQSGSFLQIYDCSDDNANQQFIAVGAPAPPPPPPAPQAPQGGSTPSNVFGIQWLGNTQMVIDVPNARNENGIHPQLYTSFGPGVAQRFQWSACGQLQWVGTDKCLDVASGTTGPYPNGTPIQMYTCWCGGANQLFQRDGNAIKIAGTNKCLDTGAGNSNGLGALLQIWDCYDAINQKFQLTPTSQQFIQSALSDTVAPYLDPTNVKLDWDVNTLVFVASGSRITFDMTGCMSSIYRVSEDAFNSCNLTDSKITPYPLMASNSTAIMTLTAATSGDVYVMCGSSPGCLAGQRQHIVAGVLSVNGTSSSSGSRSTNGASSSHSSISPIMIGLVPLIMTYLIPRLSL